MFCFTKDNMPACKVPTGPGMGARPPRCCYNRSIHAAPAPSVMLAASIWCVDREWVLLDNICQVTLDHKRKVSACLDPIQFCLGNRHSKTDHTGLEPFWFHREVRCGRKAQYFIHIRHLGTTADLLLPPLASWEKPWSDTKVSENITLSNPWWSNGSRHEASLAVNVREEWLSDMTYLLLK